MAVTVTIGSIDVTSMLLVNSLDVSSTLNERCTAKFEIIDTNGSYDLATDAGATIVTDSGASLGTGMRFDVGQAVTVTNGATVVFGGSIDAIEEEILDGGGWTTIKYTIECVDYTEILDRHLVAKTYNDPAQTLLSIVTDLNTTYLAGEGLSVANVSVGPVVQRIVWNYKTVAHCFDDLSEISGYSWWIDANKVINFRERTETVAPFAITDTSANFRHFKVRQTRQEYRNRQYIRAGWDLTASRTENRQGDGKTKAFIMTYKVGQAPTITLNGAAQTIGIKGVDSGKQWYWNKQDDTITQDDSGTALTSTDTLAVTYVGTFPIIIQSQLDAEITSRATIEGGTGIHEAVVDEPNIDSANLAQSEATALLRRYGRIPRTVEYESDTDGLLPGQLQTITRPAHNVSGSWLIESVKFHDVDGLFMRYTITALDGETLGGWEKFFKKIVAAGRRFVVRDNEVLNLARVMTDAVTTGDTVSYTTAGPVTTIGSMVVGYSEIA